MKKRRYIRREEEGRTEKVKERKNEGKKKRKE
jgi:hypothetical protein